MTDEQDFEFLTASGTSLPRSFLNEQLEDFFRQQHRTLTGVHARITNVMKSEEVNRLMVGSALPGEGSLLVALSMAIGLTANSSRSVLLIDGNPVDPALHDCFAVRQTPGLIDWIAFERSFSDVLRYTNQRGLSIVTAGEGIDTADDLYESGRFAEAMDFAADNYDYVIMDGGPLLSASNILPAVRHFDGVVQAMACEKSKTDTITPFQSRVESSSGRLIGAALTERRFYLPRFLYGKI